MGRQHSQSTRDQRLRVQTLRDAGFTYQQINQELGYTHRAIQWACTHRTTPQKRRRGRKPIITTPSRKILVDFVCGSKENRQLPLLRIPSRLKWNVSEDTIRRALAKEGFKRCVARRKPPLSETNRVDRLAWAHEHLHWTKEQWNCILWSDETWTYGVRHRRTFVTRRKYEAFYPDCVVPRPPNKGGWMFWGCFWGNTKGPGLFWEKDWGSISSATYRKLIIPVVDDYIR